MRTTANVDAGEYAGTVLLADGELCDFVLRGENDLSICGIRLGMTRDEAKAAARAFELFQRDETADRMQFEAGNFDSVVVGIEDDVVTMIDPFAFIGE